MRAIDIGLNVKTFTSKGDSFSIDVPKNLIQARKKINIDNYIKFTKMISYKINKVIHKVSYQVYVISDKRYN